MTFSALSEVEVQALPVRDLAFALLKRMPSTRSTDVVNFLASVLNELSPDSSAPQAIHGRSIHSEPALARVLGEAWDWMFINGLTASDPTHTTFRFVTRRGNAVRANSALLPD